MLYKKFKEGGGVNIQDHPKHSMITHQTKRNVVM